MKNNIHDNNTVKFCDHVNHNIMQLMPGFHSLPSLLLQIGFDKQATPSWEMAGKGAHSPPTLLLLCFFGPISLIIQMSQAPVIGGILGMMLESWKSQAVREARIVLIDIKARLDNCCQVNGTKLYLRPGHC